jgi:hypothetical protein
VFAQDAGSRAWQQRLRVEVPLPIPLVELEAANPFAVELDEPPQMGSFVPPKKLQVRGRARMAAYVDANGECPGAVPLEVPFPGLTTALVTEIQGARYEAARLGSRSEASWAVIEINLETRVKESSILSHQLDLPDATLPPEPSSPPRIAPSGRLLNLPAADPSALSSPASPKRVRVRVPGREIDVPMRALVHLTAEGNQIAAEVLAEHIECRLDD